MKLIILLDNNTIIDQYYFGEPAVSYWIRADNKNILFDVGYSDMFIKNAKKLNVDIRKADYLVLSHGHIDHTGGLKPYINLIGKKSKEVKLVAHLDVFDRKSYKGFGDIGVRKRKDEIEKYFDLNLTTKPLWITKNLCFLGEIPRGNNFEAKSSLGMLIKDGKEIPDYLIDDSALVYKSKEGLVVITGCSHSGICNIVEYAKKICQKDRILDIVGGFHLLNAKEDILKKTIKYFNSCNIETLHPCHCTDLKAKVEIAKFFKVEEVGSGSILNL